MMSVISSFAMKGNVGIFQKEQRLPRAWPVPKLYVLKVRAVHHQSLTIMFIIITCTYSLSVENNYWLMLPVTFPPLFTISHTSNENSVSDDLRGTFLWKTGASFCQHEARTFLQLVPSKSTCLIGLDPQSFALPFWQHSHNRKKKKKNHYWGLHSHKSTPLFS